MISTPKPALIALAIALVLLVSPAPASAEGGEAGTEAKDRGTTVELRWPAPALFPLPDELEPNVDFWTKIYTYCTSDQVLLHDELHLGVIYVLVDFSKLAEREDLSDVAKAKLRREKLKDVREKYRRILVDLANARPTLGDEGEPIYAEKRERIEKLFAEIPGGEAKYAVAASRLRTQTCLKDRFAEAIERSGAYMPWIEATFREHDLPLELTRLPFVESLFQLGAHSSASAGGIWQFVPSTARAYLEMGMEVDERFDPLRATEAAARHLKANHQALESWPVAITAYNHGLYGMKRAVRKVGTRDLGEIVERYRSRSFGFASRNFYAEFIAACLAYDNREHFFPGVTPDPPLEFEEFVPGHYVPIARLAQAAGTDLEGLRSLNPGLNRQLWSDHLYLPRDYRLRVPTGKLTAFESAYAALPAEHKREYQAGYRYRVRRGDTLSVIAARHGTSVTAIRAANRLRGDLIRAGQTLLIPPGRRSPSSAAPLSAPTSGEKLIHVVRRGENLTAIAQRYGTSVRAIQAANGLRNASRIYPGQKLTIHPSGRATHVVRRGETLAEIARRYGTTVAAIQAANRILGHLIHPSQVLVIP